MGSDDAELRRTAYHEAGHAVVALALGRSIHRVSVIARENQLGHVQIKKGAKRPPKDIVEAECLVLLAGLAAEGRLSGRYDWAGAHQDLEGVERLIYGRAASDRQARSIFRRLLKKVEHMLDDDGTWRAVQVIADDLLVRQSISGRAARHHYEQATRG